MGIGTFGLGCCCAEPNACPHDTQLIVDAFNSGIDPAVWTFDSNTQGVSGRARQSLPPRPGPVITSCSINELDVRSRPETVASSLWLYDFVVLEALNGGQDFTPPRTVAFLNFGTGTLNTGPGIANIAIGLHVHFAEDQTTLLYSLFAATYSFATGTPIKPSSHVWSTTPSTTPPALPVKFELRCEKLESDSPGFMNLVWLVNDAEVYRLDRQFAEQPSTPDVCKLQAGFIIQGNHLTIIPWAPSLIRLQVDWDDFFYGSVL